MALNRGQRIAIGAAGGFALAMPLLLLWPWGTQGGEAPMPAPRPVTVPPIADIAAIYQRPLLAPAEADDAAPADAPALIGIAGRINRDAVALVRLADGGSRSLSVGESVDGWRLESLAVDAAFFTRGRERVRVAMSAGDDAPTSAPAQ